MVDYSVTEKEPQKVRSKGSVQSGLPRAGEVAAGKVLLGKHEDITWSLSTNAKMWHVLITQVLKRWRQVGPS